MFLKLSEENSKRDDILKASSKTPCVDFMRWLIGEAACQMKTAILFKSPGIILISVEFRQGVKHHAVLCIPAGYHPGLPSYAHL